MAYVDVLGGIDGGREGEEALDGYESSDGGGVEVRGRFNGGVKQVRLTELLAVGVLTDYLKREGRYEVVVRAGYGVVGRGSGT